MRPALILLLLSAALAGCAMSKEVYLADGSKGYRISCDGTVQNFGSCLEKAGELCGARGFRVVNQQGEAAPFSSAAAGYTASGVEASGGLVSQSGMIITRTLFVKCL